MLLVVDSSAGDSIVLFDNVLALDRLEALC